MIPTFVGVWDITASPLFLNFLFILTMLLPKRWSEMIFNLPSSIRPAQGWTPWHFTRWCCRDSLSSRSNHRGINILTNPSAIIERVCQPLTICCCWKYGGSPRAKGKYPYPNLFQGANNQPTAHLQHQFKSTTLILYLFSSAVSRWVTRLPAIFSSSSMSVM